MQVPFELILLIYKLLTHNLLHKLNLYIIINYHKVSLESSDIISL